MMNHKWKFAWAPYSIENHLSKFKMAEFTSTKMGDFALKSPQRFFLAINKTIYVYLNCFGGLSNDNWPGIFTKLKLGQLSKSNFTRNHSFLMKISHKWLQEKELLSLWINPVYPRRQYCAYEHCRYVYTVRQHHNNWSSRWLLFPGKSSSCAQQIYNCYRIISAVLDLDRLPPFRNNGEIVWNFYSAIEQKYFI